MFQQRSSLIWFAASLLFGLAAAFVAHSWFQSVNAGTPVVVAARELPPLSRITASDVRVASVPRAALPPDAAVALDEVVGRFTRTGFVPGMVVQRAMLAGDPSEGLTGFDARLLELEERVGTNLRAFPLAVDLAGGYPLVRPGTTVDVIAQVKLGGTSTSGVLIPGAVVLGKIDKARDSGVINAPGAERGDAEATEGVVILALTPADAARLAMAVDLGRVTLAVAPVGATTPADDPPVLTEPELFAGPETADPGAAAGGGEEN